MTEAILRPVPSETSLSEDVSTVLDDLKASMHRNRDLLLTLGITVGAIFIQRWILRKELKRLVFNVEVFPFDAIGDYGMNYNDE